jgi:hypothetical protein
MPDYAGCVHVSSGQRPSSRCVELARDTFAREGAVSPDLAKRCKVLLATPRDMEHAEALLACPNDWTRDRLVLFHGYYVIDHRVTTLVLNRNNPREALLLVVSETDLQVKRDIVKELHEVTDLVMSTHARTLRAAGKDNGRMGMEGWRRADFLQRTMPPLGRYTVNKKKRTPPAKHAESMRRAAEVADLICGFETAVSPAAGVARLRLKQETAPRHGICPTYKQRFGAMGLGVSRGYMSYPHVDRGLLLETVAFLLDLEQSFASCRAGVLVWRPASDVGPPKPVLVLVPSGDPHGTPRHGPNGVHDGVGVVIVTNAPMCSVAAKRDFAKLPADPCYVSEPKEDARKPKNTDARHRVLKRALKSARRTGQNSDGRHRILMRVLKRSGIVDPSLTSGWTVAARGKGYKYAHSAVGVFDSPANAAAAAAASMR